jgi:hypothetical protein
MAAGNVMPSDGRISCLTQEVENRDECIVKMLVHSNHLGERLSAKPLFVTNMCGKIMHMNSKYIHTPNAKPYVAKEFNNVGVTESIYTKISNFHTGLPKLNHADASRDQ